MPEPPSENPFETADLGPTRQVSEAGRTGALGDNPTVSVTLSPTELVAVEGRSGWTWGWSGDLGEDADGPAQRTTFYTGEPGADPPGGPWGRFLGDYELLDILGQGGMGVVYRARQISLNRMVALKLLRSAGMPSGPELRRFQDEAEAIAALDHPAIVPIYEVGTQGECHYFSMKLISGRSLQKAIPNLRGDFRAIGRIIAGAARAVQHAHERGILHRDIKPANILLDPEGRPHVSDFGLAKRIDAGGVEVERTATVAGTPAYMAPEQVTATRGSITTATDVYGLGASLYALLSGRAPHRGTTMLEVLDSVREHDPKPLSTVDPTIPRDLDVICRKCLEKDPRRRYHSARELADELDRWLEGRPIEARPVGPAVRAALWCKRKPLAAGLAGALLITALAGSIGILINWREVRRQRDELAGANAQVRSEWESSRQLNEFLVTDLLAFSSPFEAGRRDVPVSTLLDRSSERASARFEGRPKLEGSIRQALGRGYLALGMLEKAEAELIRSAKLRESLPEGDELDRLSSDYALARLRLEQGRYGEAEPHARKALDGRRRLLGEADENSLHAAELLGVVLKSRGKLDRARMLLEETALTARTSLGEEHPVTLHALTDLAIIAHDQGRVAEAFRSLDQIARTSARVFGANHPETLFARSRLGVAALGVGQVRRAEEILAAALETARDVFGPGHLETLRIIANLAGVRSQLGKDDEAAKGFEEALKGQRAALPPDHVDLLQSEMNGAVSLLRQGQAAEAETRLRDLIPRMRARFRHDDPILGLALATTAGALLNRNKTVEAEAYITEAIAILKRTSPADHPRVVNAETTRADLCLAIGKFAEAEEAATAVLGFRSRPGGVDSPWKLGAIKSILGAALAGREKFADAEPLLLEGFRTLEADPRAPRRQIAESIARLIRLYEAWGKPDQAAKWRARAPSNDPAPPPPAGHDVSR